MQKDTQYYEELFNKAIADIENGDYQKAVDIVDTALNIDNNNYELYYLQGWCYEQLGRVEDAYYAYRIAMFLGKGSIDEQLMENQFNQLCSYAGANSYELGVSCQRLIESRIRQHEYEKTYQFLGQQLYDKNRVAANIVLSENNMLLYMMLEIVLCEKNRLSEKEFARENTIVRYGCDVQKFNDVYRQIKLMARRIWFGASIEEQKELNTVLEKNKVSGDMLAVIVKYSVREEVWQDTFARLAAIVQYRFPDIGAIILQYKNWLEGMDTLKNEKCIEPSDYDNGATSMKLDCKTGIVEYVSGTDCDIDDDTIAAIFCTNDELYAAECVKYIKRLTVPQNMKLVVVELWNSSGMAAGYNKAIEKIKAKYKLYIHHDTFIIDKNILVKLIDSFKGDKQLGMVGIAGTTKLGKEGKWWKNTEPKELRMNLYQDAVLNILKSVSIQKSGDTECADALDGILLATQYDTAWREDLFDGWHFYDISQCYEFRKNGYKVSVLNGDELFVMHETTMKKDKLNLYDKYCEKFIKEYDL